MTPQQLGDQPAFPSQETELQGTPFQKVTTTQGLTKREEFAKAALQGIISNDDLVQTCIAFATQLRATPETIMAIRAVKFAESLLAELAKPTCTCGEPHISDRVEHHHDKPCHLKESP